MEVEHSRMITWLDSLLALMHNQLPILDARYSTEPRMQQMLKDLDVYLTLPLQLLGKSVSTFYIDICADNRFNTELYQRASITVRRDFLSELTKT